MPSKKSLGTVGNFLLHLHSLVEFVINVMFSLSINVEPTSCSHFSLTSVFTFFLLVPLWVLFSNNVELEKKMKSLHLMLIWNCVSLLFWLTYTHFPGLFLKCFCYLFFSGKLIEILSFELKKKSRLVFVTYLQWYHHPFVYFLLRQFYPLIYYLLSEITLKPCY